MAKVGDMIGNEYEILKKQATGGMSNIYIAMKRNLNKTWCIKELIKNQNDPKINIKIEQALEEVRIMDGIKHEYLPNIVDVFDEKEALYIVMDYIEGEDLKKVLMKNGAQQQDDVIRWAKQLCEALIYLHSHQPPIIYRDMKPNNIMLKPDGNIKLIDFGVAKEYKEERSKDTRMFATNGYAAPEQYNGGKTDARTDIYSLGVTLFYLLTDHDPQKELYVQTPIREIDPTLSGGLEKIIMKCTMQNPDDRFQSATELLKALNEYEKEDDAYILMQWKNAKKCFVLWVCFFLCLFIAGFCFFQEKRILLNDYEQQIVLADTATNEEDKIHHYYEAITLQPLEIDTYFKLIETYKINGFTLEEELAFKKIISENLSSLKKENGYDELCFEVGKLYWYYYEYGLQQGNTIKAISATKWFKDAAIDHKKSYYPMADAYSKIGEFYSVITQKVEEADDQGLYLNLFLDLKELLLSLQNNKSDIEIVNLESCGLIIQSLDSYAKKMSMDGVKEKDMHFLFKETFSLLENIEPTTDKTKQLKNTYISYKDSCEKSISNAYIKATVETN